jgi:DNA-binding MarR family transcriptional regulator
MLKNKVRKFLILKGCYQINNQKNQQKKSSESAELDADKLTKRQTQILESMEVGVSYSTEDIAVKIGLKGPRTRQLLNELVAMGILECTAATKNRRYIRK